MQIEKTKQKLTITFKDESEAERFYEGDEYVYGNIIDTFIKGEELIVNGEDYLPRYHGEASIPEARKFKMEIPNKDYKIEYKGFIIYEGKIDKLVEHFEIFWNDDMETYESELLGCEGETIEECLEACLAEANELGDRVIDVMHSYENDFQAYDNYTKKDFIEDLRQGNYQLWSQFNFAHIALEDYFAEEGIKLFN